MTEEKNPKLPEVYDFMATARKFTDETVS